MRVHKSITPDRVEAAAEAASQYCENPGFCVKCGEDAYGVEPDARKYKCEDCGEAAVFGFAELLMVMF